MGIACVCVFCGERIDEKHVAVIPIGMTRRVAHYLRRKLDLVL